MNKHELISVIIPTRNREKPLLRALEHIYKQDYPNYEIIVVDDNSRNEIAKIVKDKFPKTVVYRSQFHMGNSYSRDKGVRLAKGDIVFFIDDDAVIEDKGIFSKGVEILENDKDIACVPLLISDYIDRNYFNPSLPRKYRKKQFIHKRKEVPFFIGTAVFLRKKAFLECGGLSNVWGYGGYEANLSYRLLKKGYRIYYAGDLIAYHGTIPRLPDHFSYKYYKLRYRSIFCNSFITAARYLPFPYFISHIVIWTLYHFHRYYEKKMLSDFGKDFWYVIRNFIRVWHLERHKYILDHKTIDRIKKLKGRLWY